jgi:hypothetical protein
MRRCRPSPSRDHGTSRGPSRLKPCPVISHSYNLQTVRAGPRFLPRLLQQCESAWVVGATPAPTLRVGQALAVRQLHLLS